MGRPKKHASEDDAREARNAAKRLRRLNESPEERAIRLSQHRERDQRRLLNLSQEDRITRQARNTASQRKCRENMSQEDKNSKKLRQAELQRERRKNESQEERVVRQVINATRQRERRENLSQEERAILHFNDAQRQRIRMANETPEQLQQRRQRTLLYRQMRKHNRLQQLQEMLQVEQAALIEDESAVLEHYPVLTSSSRGYLWQTLA